MKDEEVQLRVRGLTKRYSSDSEIGPVTLSVNRGEFFSVLGPSGCGKTTILRCVAGFEKPTTGEIWVDGERIDTHPPHQRDIGLVFQSYALFPHLSVFENVAFGLRLRRVPESETERRVGRLLSLVGLADLGGRLPRQLSGGQQQRVAIARSLVLEPRLLLLDEPLSNLDSKLRIQMRSELRSLQQQLGKTSIYVTHDQSEALALSDRIAVLSKGKIEQIGAPSDIYERPASSFVADFIGASNLFPARIESAGSVRTEKGFALSASNISAAVGSSVVIMIRPEHIECSAPGEKEGNASNCFKAKIEEVTYLGQDTQLRIVTENGDVCRVAVKNGQEKRRFAAGEMLEFHVDRVDVQVLER